ncbi:hypothetical protein Peur_009627 [Populus x canadensis]
MRHRLDSKGQRKGKVIAYRVSELRVVELFDGLCDKMEDYTLENVDSKRYEWVRVDSWDNLSGTKYLFMSGIHGDILVLVWLLCYNQFVPGSHDVPPFLILNV